MMRPETRRRIEAMMEACPGLSRIEAGKHVEHDMECEAAAIAVARERKRNRVSRRADKDASPQNGPSREST